MEKSVISTSLFSAASPPDERLIRQVGHRSSILRERERGCVYKYVIVDAKNKCQTHKMAPIGKWMRTKNNPVSFTRMFVAVYEDSRGICLTKVNVG